MYKQGEILLIPVPFTDLTSTKKRPVFVLSSDRYNNKTNDILVAAITSNINEKDYAVIISKVDLEIGDLKVDSCIRTDKIYSLSQGIVIKTFGRVKLHIMNRVKDKLNQLICNQE